MKKRSDGRYCKQILLGYKPDGKRNVTNLYYAGVDVKTAQYILGHSSVQMTLEVYTHLDMLRTEAAAVKVNEFFEEMLSQSKISQDRFSA